MQNWIDVNDELPKDYCHVLVTKKYYDNGFPIVDYNFFTPDRELAKKTHGLYSRKKQGKLSVHFKEAQSCFVITHWMPLPKPSGVE